MLRQDLAVPGRASLRGRPVSTDPRVLAVAEALRRWPNGVWLTLPGPVLLHRQAAEVAVAALDAYDEPKFRSVVHECCERPVEADLRERIAAEIEAEAETAERIFCAFHSGTPGVAAAMRYAASIVRGETP